MTFVDIPGATGPQLIIPNAQVSDTGDYQCVITSEFGGTQTIEVLGKVGDPPVFTQHPQSTVVDEGDQLTLTALATGTPPIAYQWQRLDLADWIDIPGATSATFTKTAELSDTGYYRVRATSPYGQAYSNVGDVEVLALPTPPVFTEHPQPVSVDEGDPLILSAMAAGTEPISYGPWKKNGVDLPGTTSRILDLGPATLDMAGSYTVPASNVAGSVMSNAALVTVTPVVPVISGTPYQGQSLTSTRAGQWTINDSPILGETGDTLVVPESVLLGDKIACAGSNELEVVRIPTAWGITVDTTYTTAKTTANNQFWLMGRDGVNETVTIYWGDGTKSVVDAWNHADRTHTYATGGTYQIQAVGLTTVNFNYSQSASDLPKISSIDQWGETWAATQTTALAAVGSPKVISQLPEDAGDGLSSTVTGSNMFVDNAIPELPPSMSLPLLTNGSNMFQGNPITELPQSMSLPLLTNGNAMFYNCQITELPQSMSLPLLTNGNVMFYGNTINTEDYSGLIIRTEASNPNSNTPFHGGNSKYNPAAAVARADLVARGWTITDGGPA